MSEQYGQSPDAPQIAKRILIGDPLTSEQADHQLLPKRMALPIFASDALSSVAYGPQEMLMTLALGGLAFLTFAPWVAAAVVVLLVVVVLSYRQLIRAYPSGGGDYEVASKNFGEIPGVVVAAALLVDYILTVSVSIASGVDNIISAVPELDPFRVELAVGFVVLIESLGTLSTLVTDLLDVSRVQAGALAVSSTAVDAAGCILAAVDELGLGPTEVTLDLGEDLPPLQADPVLLQRVLVNVIANARRFAPDDTQVVVSTRKEGTREAIRVIDHGPGVSPQRRDDIFQPFQRLGDTDNSTGLGLGLALSRGFAAGMGGSLRPDETPGGGLTMTIRMPLADEEGR